MTSYQMEPLSLIPIEALHLETRKCKIYVPYRRSADGDVRAEVQSAAGSRDLCWCGHTRNMHEDVIKNNEERWDMARHTRTEPISSQDSNPRVQARDEPKYVRCDIKTSADVLENLLLNVWQIKPPDLLLSVVGGAKYFKLSEGLEEKFCNAIIDATRRANAWLLTSGFNIGIVQMVGQALKKVRLTNPGKDITAIAVTKYGCIRGDSHIIRAIDPSGSRDLGPRRHGEHGLEPFHTHYILLDDGTKRRYDGIDDRIAVLMDTVSKGQSLDPIPKPAVTLVVEGGYTTIMNIYYSLSYGIPVVLVEGSGRVADFFARWLSYLEDNMDGEEDRDPNAGIKKVYEYHERKRTRNTSSQAAPSPKIPRMTTTMNNMHKSVETDAFRLHYNDPALDKMFQRHKDDLRKDLKHVLSHQSEEIWQTDRPKRLEKRINKLLPFVNYCLQPAVRSNISLYDLSGNDNLTDAILSSVYYARRKIILDAERRENREKIRQSLDSICEEESLRTFDEEASQKHMEQRRQHDKQMLELALKWNCLEVAKELIVRGSIENMKPEEQEKAVLTMLIEDLPAFFHYFIELGISLPNIILGREESIKDINIDEYNDKLRQKFYSDKRIEDIYKKTNCLLFDMTRLDTIRRDMIGTEVSYIEFDHVQISHLDTIPLSPIRIATIQLDTMPRNTSAKIDIRYLSVKGLNHILKQLIGDTMEEIYPRSHHHDRISIKHVVDPKPSKKRMLKDTIIDKAFRDLFIWAILMNNLDMAKMLLGHINPRICAALIARKILKSLRDRYALYSDQKTDYTKAMDYFEDYAIECVKLCYKHNQEKACELVLRECELFGNVTCLSLAIEADAKRFVGQPCCVRAMSNVWYGMIDRDKTALSWILLAIGSVGLSTPLTVNFRTYIRTDESAEDAESGKNDLKPYGITYSDPHELQHVSPRIKSKGPKEFLKRCLKTQLAKMYYFHQAPVTKFAYDCVHYLWIVILFSYVMLFKFDPPSERIPSINWTEIVLILLVSTMLIAETRSLFSLEASTLRGKIKHYFTTPLKIVGTFSYGLFYVGLILRFIYQDPTANFYRARIVMGYTLQIWWLRAIKYINVVPSLGPHIVAIHEMLKDLAFFICLISIVMCGYGTASRSIAYYGNITFTADGIFHDIMYPVYYLMYSQLDTETAYLDNSTGKDEAIAVHILLAFNMLLIVILLINLLIALFDKRFEKVQEDAKNIWHDQQYRIVREYFHRTAILPPFSIIVDTYKLFCIFFNWIQKRNIRARHAIKSFKMIDKNPLLKKSWDEFEGASTYEYAQAHALLRTKKSEEIIRPSNVPTRSMSIPNEKKLENVFEDDGNTEKSLKTVADQLTSAVRSLEEMKSRFNVSSPHESNIDNRQSFDFNLTTDERP